ncbi:CopG family transcriptional regulator [Candidatus Aerophobetes bacterium]|uniref:CopG family transcriptional regulator n=1 Tax=Aerophobetes bacterium TaxID=2030807 RepID=A0A662D4A9_UNCAE|nr:MAG: CopG family transcriptional regulator [Candidatus Aerophobetes bacterium]
MSVRVKVMSFSLPRDMAEEIEKRAKKEKKMKSELLREAIRQYLERKKWEELQRDFSLRARKFGVTTEEDIEKIVDEIRK